jgi:hypothetical protein
MQQLTIVIIRELNKIIVFFSILNKNRFDEILKLPEIMIVIE